MMLGTIKIVVEQTVTSEKFERDQTIPDVIYGYRRHRKKRGYSPFELMSGVITRMGPAVPSPLME